MMIVVVNRTKNLTPELPQASEVKLCRSPFQINGSGEAGRLVSSRKQETTAIKELIRRVSEETKNDPLSTYMYIEIDSDLPTTYTAKIGLIHDFNVTAPIVTVTKGMQFATRQGTSISVAQIDMVTTNDLNRFSEIMQVARWLAYES